MERMIKEALKEKRGIQINGESLTNISYADDTVLLAEDEQELQEMLEAVNQVCKRYRMTLNSKKTKSMFMGKGEIEKAGGFRIRASAQLQIPGKLDLQRWKKSGGN